jgi:hypothetical protein
VAVGGQSARSGRQGKVDLGVAVREVEHVVLLGGFDRRAAPPHVRGADQKEGGAEHDRPRIPTMNESRVTPATIIATARHMAARVAVRRPGLRGGDPGRPQIR